MTILTVGRYLSKVALSLHEPSRSIIDSLYFVMPHFEWSFEMRNLIVHDWPLIDWSYFGLNILYSLAYAAVFLVAACLVFRRKAVN
jgi:ABC-type transport system involved in multi-copper enzyme maturation permease subunit